MSEIETAEPQQDAQEAQTPAEPAKNYAPLDGVIPDDYDDEEFRGKPVAEILRVAKQYKQEIGVARGKSRDYNDVSARLDALQRAVEAERNRQPQRPQETTEQQLNRLRTAPDRFVDERVNPVREDINTVRQEIAFERAERARDKARSLGNFDEAAWDENTPAIAAIMHARGLSASEPKDWLKAAEPFKPVLVSKPKAEVPTSAAPVAGGAKSTVKPGPSAPRFKNKQAETAAKEAASFMGYKPGTKRYDELLEELAREETEQRGNDD